MLLWGFVILMIRSISGLAIPQATKILLDDVIGKRHMNLLLPLVGGVVLASLIQVAASFTLTQLLSKEGQRVIAELRREEHAHVSRLPRSFYDSTKSGTPVARVMTDAEGQRNLICTGQM